MKCIVDTYCMNTFCLRGHINLFLKYDHEMVGNAHNFLSCVKIIVYLLSVAFGNKYLSIYRSWAAQPVQHNLPEGSHTYCHPLSWDGSSDSCFHGKVCHHQNYQVRWRHADSTFCWQMSTTWQQHPGSCHGAVLDPGKRWGWFRGGHCDMRL